MNRTQRAIARQQAIAREREKDALIRRLQGDNKRLLNALTADMHTRRAHVDAGKTGKHGPIERRPNYQNAQHSPIARTHIDSDTMDSVFGNAVNA